METTLEAPAVEPPAEAVPKPAPKKPIVATLVLEAGGVNLQRIRVEKPVRFLVFHYQNGRGRTIEYTDLAAFHRDEAALRLAMSKMRFPFNIRTIIGSVDNSDTLRASLISMIADTTGHRPTKYEKLKELRALIDAETERLEKQGVLGPKDEGEKKEPEKPKIPQPSDREVAIERRRAFLRRAGEEYVRGLVMNFSLVTAKGKPVQKLNNFQGMMDAIIKREFPGAAIEPVVTLVTKGDEVPAVAENPSGFVPVKADVSNPENPVITEVEVAPQRADGPDLFTMPIDDLRTLAQARGITVMGRNEIIDAMTAPTA